MIRIMGSILLLLALVLPAAAAKRVALVIGNAKYTHVSELKTPPRDVRLIVDTLKSVGFDDVRLAEDLTNEQMRIALQEFSDVAASADMAIIYFAGHGIEVNSVNYLVPIDAKLEKAKDASFQAIKLDQFREAVSGAFKLRMVVLDACRNNPFRLVSKDGTRSLLNRGLVEVQPGTNELIAYSAQAGVVADDGPAEGNSPFAASLAKWVKTPGLDIRFVMGHVRDEVLAGTGPTDNRDGPQIPYVESSLGGDQIALNSAPVVAQKRLIQMEANGSGDYKTLAEAIEKAEPGSRIELGAGTYLAGFEVNKPLEIVGTAKGRTAILEASEGAVIVWTAGSGKIENLTVRQTAEYDVRSGPSGIEFIDGGSATLRDCFIVSSAGSGIFIADRFTHPNLIGNTIANSGQEGIYLVRGSKALIEGNDIFGNVGDGISVNMDADPHVVNNRIRDGKSGGIFISAAKGRFDSNSIFGNVNNGISIFDTVAPIAAGNVIIRNGQYELRSLRQQEGLLPATTYATIKSVHGQLKIILRIFSNLETKNKSYSRTRRTAPLAADVVKAA